MTALDWAFDLPLSSPAQKSVLLVLARHVNYETNDCFPGQDRIAEQAGICRQTVNKVIGELELLGLVARIQRSRFGTCLYHLNVGAKLAAAVRRLRSRPAKQGELFSCPTERQPGVVQGDTNSSDLKIPEEREREQVRSRAPAAADQEHVSRCGMTFTVRELHDLEQRHGAEHLQNVLADMGRYRESGRQIRAPYWAALKWRIPPGQPPADTPQWSSRRRPHVQMRVEQRELTVFNECLCTYCPTHHVWKTGPYSGGQMAEHPCDDYVRENLPSIWQRWHPETVNR